MNWISNLNAGDRVILNSNGNHFRTHVKRVTATQVITNYQRFRKKDRQEVGGGYLRDTISEAIPEATEEVSRENVVRNFKKYILEAVNAGISYEKSVEIKAILTRQGSKKE